MISTLQRHSSTMSNDPAASKDVQIIGLAYANKLEKIIDFLETNDDLDILSVKDARYYTLLHIACLHNQINIARALLNDVKSKQLIAEDVRRWINAKTDEGFTALHFASFKGNIELIKILESHGADIMARNQQGLTVIHIAAQGDQPVSIAYFQNKGLSLTDVDNKGSTSLHWACFLGMENATVYLTTWGVSCNDQDSESGLTPLHLAVISGNPRVVRRLLLKGADPNIINKEGKRPIDIAMENEYDNIVQILQEKNKILRWLGVKPGFQRKRNRLSLYLFIVLFLLIVVPNAIFVGPYVERIEWVIFYGIFSSLTFLFFLLSWLVNPGTIKAQDKQGVLNLLLNNDPHLVCSECVIVKPPRSKHCEYCNACISVYDHHCPWINNCIGARNHGYFICFTLLILFSVLYLGILGVLNFDWTIDWSLSHQDPIYKFAPQLFSDKHLAYIFKQIFCLVDIVNFLLFFVPLAALNYIQLGNFSTGKTTSERFGFNATRDNINQSVNQSLASFGEGGTSSTYLKQSSQREKQSCFGNCYTMCCENKDDPQYNYKIAESPNKYGKHILSPESPDYAAI